MLAYYLHNLNPVALQLGDAFVIRWYGLSYALAFLSAYLLLVYLAKRRYLLLAPEKVGDLLVWTALLGVLLGGRLGYVILYNPELFATPLEIFKVWRGGMASHGGMVGVVVVVFLFSRRTQTSFLNLGDNLVTVAPIGLFLGRCANFVNGELYGRPSSQAWAVQFPTELFDRADAHQILSAAAAIDPNLQTLSDLIEKGPSTPGVDALLRSVLIPRHPSQLYEAFAEGLLLAAILWLLRTKWPFHHTAHPAYRPPMGLLSGCFFSFYAIGRIICEQFREPDSPLLGALTKGQFYSLFALIFGLVLIAFSLHGARAKAQANPLSAP